MSGQHSGIRSHQMDRTAALDFLQARGHGVLSLADGSEAYAVPVSYGYADGDGPFLYLQHFAPSSTKYAFVEQTETACLTVYDVATREDWTSVVATGELRELGETKRWTTSTLVQRITADEVMVDNAWIPSFDVPLDELEGSFFVLDIDAVTGLRGTGAKSEA